MYMDFSTAISSGASVITRVSYGTTVHDINVSLLDEDEVLDTLNSYNIGNWVYDNDTNIYYCYYSNVPLVGFSFSNDHIITATAIGISNGYLRDYLPCAMATMLETITVTVPREPIKLNYGTCPCTCDFEELVFSGPTSTDSYRTDETSYLFKKFLPSDNYDIKLYNGDNEITIDNTIGIIYDYGDLKRNGIPDYNYSGFIINWHKVFINHGYGKYRLIGSYLINGVSMSYESHIFKLCEYNVAIALGTIKITCYQDGYIESDDMDLTGFNWMQSVRVDGKLTKGVPKLEQDNYMDSGRVITQIQDQVKDIWNLEIKPIPASVANFLVYNVSLSNRIYISDYNINPEVYADVDLLINEITEFKSWVANTNVRASFKCSSRKQNILKRNFR